MQKDLLVDYDDFSGGLYVAGNSSKQPKNTFVGSNMVTCEADGTLVPAAAWVPRSDPVVVSSPPSSADGAAQAYIEPTIVGQWLYVSNGAHTAMIREAIDEDTAHHAWDFQWGGVSRISNAVPNMTNSGFARMGLYVVWFAIGTDEAYLHNSSGGSLTTALTPAGRMQYPTTFGQFIVAAGSSSATVGLGSKLFWCEPTDPTSWPAANFVQIGGTGYDITALVVVGSSLMVGKPDGWWQVTGVLGQNQTIVQVATEGPSGLSVVTADGVVTFPGRLFDGSAVRILRGSVVSTAAFWPYSTPTTQVCYQAGGHMLALGTAGEIVMRSPSGRWARLDTPHQNGTTIQAFASTPPRHPFAYAWLSGFPYRMLLAPVNPTLNAAGTAFNTSTVNLAEYRHTSPFRIHEVHVEVDLGFTAVNATRSVGLTMLTPSQPEEGSTVSTAFSAAGSTSQTRTLSAMASTTGQKVTIRFTPTDGQDTFSMTPQVTLQGVKLRRVLVRCSEVN